MHAHGEPARRTVRLHAAEAESQAVEPLAHAAPQLLERRRHVARGQLLDADLEQQLARGHDFLGFWAFAAIGRDPSEFAVAAVGRDPSGFAVAASGRDPSALAVALGGRDPAAPSFPALPAAFAAADRKSTRLNSSHLGI